MKTSLSALFLCAAIALPGMALADAGHKVKPYRPVATDHMPSPCMARVTDVNGNTPGTGTNHLRPCKPIESIASVKPCPPMVVDVNGNVHGTATNHARPCATARAQ